VPLCLHDPADLVHNYDFNLTTDLIPLFPQHCKSSLAAKCICLFFHFHFFICLLHQVLNLYSCVYVENWVILDFEPGTYIFFGLLYHAFTLNFKKISSRTRDVASLFSPRKSLRVCIYPWMFLSLPMDNSWIMALNY